MEYTNYNHKDLTKELQNKINEIKMICGTHSIPMFMTFAMKNENDKTEYMSELVDPVLLGLNLYDDHIHEHMKILRGFTVVSANNPLEIECDVITDEN